MKISKKVKIISIILLILMLIGALIFYFANKIINLADSTSDIKNEFDIEYNKNEIAQNQPTNQDLQSLISKLNNNVDGMVVNGNLNIMNNFKFTADFTLSLKEFCCLLNLVNNYENGNEVLNFVQLDLQISNSVDNKYNLNLYIEIEKSQLNKQFKLGLNNNILLKIENIRNANNIATQTQILSINGINISQISEKSQNFVNSLNNLNIFDEISHSLIQLFNCNNIEFTDAGVIIHG